MRPPDAFEVLREPRFRLLFGSRTVSVFGGTMADIALAFAVLRIGSRPRSGSSSSRGSGAVRAWHMCCEGPLSEVVGVASALYLAAAANIMATLVVLAMPTVRGLRGGPEPARNS